MPRSACPGPLSRRSFLKIGTLGVGGISLADFLRIKASAQNSANAPSDTSVIFIWMPGGPPHMEMYDMKPEAPADYRGDFNPISTNVPGLDVCEHMPLHAKTAHLYNIVRSISHEFADHGGGHKRFLTGRVPKQPVGFVNDYPMVGSIVSKCRETEQRGIPNYICGTEPGRAGIDVYSFGSAYLPQSTHPFMVPGDPTDPKFEIKNISLDKRLESRLDDRLRLLQGFDRLKARLDQNGMMDSMDEFNQRAVNMLTSSAAREAFDLSKEPQELRERYGMHCWGQRALMARRLVEAGCSFVTMVYENPYQSGVERLKQGTYNWDSHAVNCHLFDDTKLRLPFYDRAVTALIEDLHNRGLEKRVLLVVTGEFGRTPRITTQIGSQTGIVQPGRDHWPRAMSLLVSGGGMRTGQVIGSTNSKGEEPIERPLTPNDLWATVYRHLGIESNASFPDHNGRPMPILPDGEPIDELLPVA